MSSSGDMSPARLFPRPWWRECVLLLLLAAAAAFASYWFRSERPPWTKPGVAEVELGEVGRWKGGVLWVDAREGSAYEARHVPGAVLLNESHWAQLLPGFLERWQPGVRVVVYCDSQACDASQAVALRLKRELALSEINVLKGGWSAWRQAQH